MSLLSRRPDKSAEKPDPSGLWQAITHAPLAGDTPSRDAIRELAFYFVRMEFPKEEEIFDTFANSYLSRTDLSPVGNTPDLQKVGLTMGNLGSLGSLQALSFATCVWQRLARVTGTETLSIGEAASRIVEQPDFAEQLIDEARSLGLDAKASRKMAQLTLSLFKGQARPR